MITKGFEIIHDEICGEQEKLDWVMKIYWQGSINKDRLAEINQQGSNDGDRLADINWRRSIEKKKKLPDKDWQWWSDHITHWITWINKEF